jgi:hypothetical protein
MPGYYSCNLGIHTTSIVIFEESERIKGKSLTTGALVNLRKSTWNIFILTCATLNYSQMNNKKKLFFWLYH